MSLLPVVGVATAQLTGTLYDFGTMQQGNYATAQPGDNVTFNLFFFVDSEYGNRITHIRVNVDEAPAGWIVALDPSIHTVELNISGILTNSSENLNVEPRPRLPAPPDTPEEGFFYLASPSGKGYLQARRLEIMVHVPPSAELGKSYPIKIQAEGFWFGQRGNIALTQTRSFPYIVEVASREYSEQLVAKAAPATSGPSGFEIFGSPLALPLLLIIVIIAAVYFFMSKRKDSSGEGVTPPEEAAGESPAPKSKQRRA